jgi:hypothetical protein
MWRKSARPGAGGSDGDDRRLIVVTRSQRRPWRRFTLRDHMGSDGE